MSKHMKFKCVVKSSLSAHKFQKVCCSGIIPFVYHVGKGEIHKFLQYEVFVYVGRVVKNKKGVPMAAI